MTQLAPSGPGVPALLSSYATQVVDAITILTADAEILQRYLAGPQWGIFSATAAPASASSTLQSISSGLTTAAKAVGITAPSRTGYTPLLVGNYTGSAVADVAFNSDAQVPTYPVEQGGFASYDKVQMPYEAKVTICIGGSIQDRRKSLGIIDNLKTTATLVNIFTPEIAYQNATVMHYDYDRSATAGAGMLKVTIGLEEIRQGAVATSGNAVQPNGTNSVNGGTVQGYTPLPSTVAVITSTPLH